MHCKHFMHCLDFVFLIFLFFKMKVKQRETKFFHNILIFVLKHVQMTMWLTAGLIMAHFSNRHESHTHTKFTVTIRGPGWAQTPCTHTHMLSHDPVTQLSVSCAFQAWASTYIWSQVPLPVFPVDSHSCTRHLDLFNCCSDLLCVTCRISLYKYKWKCLYK